MLNVLGKKVSRTLGFACKRCVYTRHQTFHAKSHPLYRETQSTVGNSLKPDSNYIRFIDGFPGRVKPRGLSHGKWNTATHKLLHEKRAIPLYTTVKGSTVQCPGNNSNSISSPLRNISSFSNRIEKKKCPYAKNGMVKRFDSSHCKKSDQIADKCEKKSKRIKAECSAQRSDRAVSQKNPLCEAEKLSVVFRDSPTSETRSCRPSRSTETISGIRDRPQDYRRPEDSTRLMAQPHPPREARVQDTSIVQPEKPLPPRPPQPPSECKQRGECRVDTLKVTPSRWCFSLPLNSKSTKCKLHQVVQSASNCIKNLRNECKSARPAGGSGKESRVPYITKMRECLAPRLRQCSGQDLADKPPCKGGAARTSKIQDCSEQTIPDKVIDTFEDKDPCKITVKEFSLKNLVFPKIKDIADSMTGPAKPVLTKSGKCRVPKPLFKASVNLADFGDERPNVSALKYRLSKCPCINDMWRNCEKLPVVPPDPLPKPKRMFGPTKLKRQSVSVKTVSSTPGEWRKQRSNVRQRIHKCPREGKPSKPDDNSLNHCSILIDNSNTHFGPHPLKQTSESLKTGQYRCTGITDKPRNKNYRTKMDESREAAQESIRQGLAKEEQLEYQKCKNIRIKRFRTKL